MCGRYSLHSNPEVVALQFRLNSVPRFKSSYNIAPAAEVLVVRDDGPAIVRWQLGGKYHNLRADTVTQKPFWSEAYRKRRCLIPANGFYEWRRWGTRSQPYYLRPAQRELFAFAGLYERETCAVLTTEANEAVRRIHDRMPVIIAPQDYEAWLGGADGLLNPSTETLEAYPVSEAVNRAALDEPRLIEPVPSGLGQRGATGELFGE